MKLIIIILILFPVFVKAQVDTIGVVSKASKSGVFYMDTIKVDNNNTDTFLLSIRSKGAFGLKTVIVQNTHGVYKIVSNLNPIAYKGLTGTKFEVVLLNKLVMVKVTGTKDILPWQYIKLNTKYR